MTTSLVRGNLRLTAIIIVAVILLLLISGIALGQDEEPLPEVPEVEIQIIDESTGLFEGNTLFWVLGILLVVVIILLVFLVGRSGNRGA